MTETSNADFPRIISVDDHVVEPPTLWTDRLPSKYGDRIPHVVREKFENPADAAVTVHDGWGDVWHYDGLRSPMMMLMAAVGAPELNFDVTNYDIILPGCWKQTERLADMDANHVEVSMCYPNTLPRFCGQTFAERDDKELALLCVQAYNDWMIDEWCAGAGKGRLVPVTMVPLWDPELAAAEVRRCAAKGSHAITFSENPHPLGLPSIHSGKWDPMFRACQETETVVNMHIGSSSRMPGTTPDALLGLPSSATTLPDDRPQRTAAFEMVRRRGWVDDYSGIRVDRNGRRFEIVRGTIWEVRDDAGVRVGDAAVLEVTADIDDA